MRLLPTTEAALLDWAINLMADVAQEEHHNKMNARNVARVFAPNMTQVIPYYFFQCVILIIYLHYSKVANVHFVPLKKELF